MPRSLGERLQELRRIVRLHTNWLTVTLLGRDSISDIELQELEKYGKLPLDETIDFVKKSYILGRFRSMLKSSEYKTLNYESVEEQVAAAGFTTLEEYALQHVKLHAADGVKGLAADLAAGAFDRLKAATQATLNEASVRGIIRDTLALAIIEKQNSQKVASTLAKDLKTDWSRDWRRVAETELHRAKIVGMAQAIVNKLGVYANSDGADSLVSIVPSSTRCDDCGSHFLDVKGNPRVFRLSHLLEQGSNADVGVKHTRSGGLHNHWKTTLPPLHPRCYSKDTDVLTRRGWIPIYDLTIEDEVLSLDPISRDLAYVTVEKTMSYENEPTLIRFSSRNFDLKVTKDHNMCGLSDWQYKHDRRSKLQFWGARHTATSRHLYRSSEWIGSMPVDLCTFGLSLEEFCTFMGYYLSEGSCHPSPGQINISQFKKESKEIMWKSLSSMPWTTCTSVQKGIYVFHKQLWQYLQQFGKSHEKFIPEEIKSLPNKYLNLFLDAYILGDGCRQRGSEDFRGGGFREEVSVSTSSTRMAADIGELFLKTGFRPSYLFEEPKTVQHHNGLYTSKHGQWRITRCYSQWASVASMAVEEIPYNDTVYCVELEKFHTLYVRVEGKCSWSGNCGCRIVYIPQGMGWESGKLQVVDERVYIEELKKAVDTGSVEATIKPPGPESSRGPAASVQSAVSPPSMSGAPAPGNVAGPGAPKKNMGPAVEWEYYSGEGQPPAEGGWEQSPGGSWRRPKGSGKAGVAAPEIESQKRALKEQEATQWNKSSKPAATVVNHLSKGDISHTRPLSHDDVGSDSLGMGASEAKTLMVVIDGNGRGVMKPAISLSKPTWDRIANGEAYTEGGGTVPHGSFAQNEVDAYGYMTYMFGEGFCPATTMREHEGENKSVQQWAEGTQQSAKFVTQNKAPGDRNPIDTLMRTAADPDKLKEKMGDLIFADMAMNNNDRHMGNVQLVVNEDDRVEDLVPVDHGPTMANDFMGFKNSMALFLARGGHKIKVSDKTLQKSKNTTFGDIKRSMAGKKDWQCAQQLVRMRYAEHLMQTEGHIDYKRLETDMFLAGVDAPLMPNAGMQLSGKPSDIGDMIVREESRKLSHQMFEDFALDYLDSVSSDSTHPDHEFAKEWKDKGLLMGPGAVSDPEGHRASGKHKAYENSVRSQRKALGKIPELRERQAETTQQKEEPSDPFAATINPSGSGRIPTTSEAMNTAMGTAPVKRITKGFELYLADPNKPFKS